ncbi:transcriptional activator MN1 [Colossoma macropomum]|uniref:transcriptional activator MN1 n=1 Tax=Colossoma macropomum TaxID=42526 RepID=UPI0018639FC8|nr:transcriptional activator MN1 [Colossoma macropomum]
MNANYNTSGFHMKAPSIAVEPVLDPLNEPPMQGLNFMPGREQYGFQPHSHGDMLTTGLQQQHQLHMPPPFNSQQLNPDQPSHPYHDGVASCLHGDRHIGFNGSNTGHQQMFASEFGQLTEAQTRECLSQQQQQQRLASMPDYHVHSHPNSNHAVPAPCLPLDQSPNRAASFHGLPSSSPESNRLEHYRLFPQGRAGGSQYCFPCDPLPGHFDVTGFSTPDSTEPRFSYCEAESQMAGCNFPTFNHGGSRALIGSSKVDQQLPQQNTYSERFGNRGKLEPGVSARHHLMAQQRGPMARQNPGSPVLPRLYHAPDFIPNSPDMQNGSAVVHAQHGQMDHPMHRLSNHSMHSFGEPMFNVPQLGPQPPHQQHLNSFPYLNMAKRPRFDLPNGSAGESCSPMSSSLHNRPGLENHLSPSAFPAPMGDFTAHVMDGFPSGLPHLSCGPHQQQPLPRRQNAAMMIKQMASRNQQHRLRQAELQPLSHQGDITPNGMVQRGPLGSMSQVNFEKKHNFHGNFEAQSPHLPHENSWFPDSHQQCRETNIHAMEQTQNGHNPMFRSGVTTGDMQSLNSPGPHSQFENGMNNTLQVHPPNDGTMQPNTPLDRSQHEFGGAAMRRQHSFPPGGPNQQGTPQSNPPGFISSPGNYQSHPEYLSSQHLSVSKLGALSLGNLNKASTKDSVFGQSCLAALSTACQNMIASLGAPNLNVTFNKKSQNEAKRKPGQVEQDVNSSGGGGACGPGAEYFQSNASQNSQTSCSGNNNNATAGQSAPGQMAKRETSTLSPNNNIDSGNEGKAATGSGRGRGKRRRDSGHISPGNFSPSCSSNPVVSPGQQASSLSMGIEGHGRTPDGSLVSPSFGKPDLATSMDSGIQSVGKSDGVSPCMDYLDDASPNYSNEDPRTNRTSIKCNSDNRTGYPDTPCMEQVRTPLGSSGQDEVHPLEILQAQIQLQRQQFSISEDQPLGGKTGKKPDCPSGPNGDCALASGSPESGKGSVNTIDLDSLMTEQHATWYGPSSKALIKDPGNGKCMGFWDRARGQSDNKEGLG